MKAPKGFLFSGVASGIKKGSKADLGLIYCPGGAQGVCFFTENKVKAAPLILAMSKLKKNKGRIKAIVVNSGSANCFTAKKGLHDAEEVCKRISKMLKVDSRSILPSSTGIIGKRLPLKKILKNAPRLIAGLKSDPVGFSKSIITTDTDKKIAFKKIVIKKRQVTILGIAKGAGMIYPRLKNATMLGFILTDANISRSLLSKAAKEAVETSFNSITVDGCTSTNDSVFVLASGKANTLGLRDGNKDFRVFSKALKDVCLDLAKRIVRDGEGATKFIEIKVLGVASEHKARQAGFAIANSNLFKTAMYGQNPNWGRIIQALGQEGIDVDEKVRIKASALGRKNISLSVDLKKGRSSWTVYTSDLSPKYVKINADYS